LKAFIDQQALDLLAPHWIVIDDQNMLPGWTHPHSSKPDRCAKKQSSSRILSGAQKYATVFATAFRDNWRDCRIQHLVNSNIHPSFTIPPPRSPWRSVSSD
jgi:hypothetical protein